nr:MAG TPA: hypothetical protein [Caudoviricetes sp.]
MKKIDEKKLLFVVELVFVVSFITSIIVNILL